ncbi:MAG: MarC family protein, partial [Verrucomicrobiota bacterium]
MIALAILLFLIMDPFGNLVIVNALLKELTPRERRIVILREAAIATGILLLAALGGGSLLDLLGLKDHSLRLAGGIVLFLIALGMLFPSRRLIDETTGEPPLIVPIAMPLIAGPSALSMVILFSKEHPLNMAIGAVVLASLGSVMILVASPALLRFLGRRGTTALERLMGMLLIMLSVQ